MWTCFIILFLYYFIGWKLVEGRQYDVNAESIRLFGEDLNTTLLRFRQTPEYLKILNFRVDKLMDDEDNMMKYMVLAYKTNMLAKRIEEALNDLYDDEKHEAKASSYVNVMPFFPNYLRGYSGLLSDNTTSTTTLSPVEILDAFATDRSVFSVAERNAFKDIGFQVAKAAVQRMIKEMGPEEDDSERKSTRMPPLDNKENNKKETTTTKHVTSNTEPKESVHILRADDTDDSSATFGFRFGKN